MYAIRSYYEIIQVQEQQRQGATLAPGQPQQQVQLLAEQAPVGQGGQAVVVGHLPEAILGLRHFPDGLVELRNNFV